MLAMIQNTEEEGEVEEEVVRGVAGQGKRTRGNNE